MTLCARLYSQEPDTSSETTSGAVQEATPRGFYLRNRSGDLVYVPDVTYEEFEKLLKEQRKLARPLRPTFSVKVMSITGEVKGDRFEAVVAFTLEGIRSEGVPIGTWFRVPLRFNEAFLHQEPTFEGPGRHFLTFDADTGGYICWVQMSADAVHEVKLPLLIPVNRVGEESRLTLHTPSPLASTLTMTVPENPAEGTIQPLTGDTSRTLAFTTNNNNQGVFTTRGLRGDVSLNWHESRSAEERADVRLDVFGTIVVTADELLQEVQTEGRFVVKGFGGPIEAFQVLLPPGMRLRDVAEPGYTVRQLPGDTIGGASPDGTLIEVRLDRPTSNEAEIRLVAELPSDQSDPAWPLTVSKLVDSSLEFTPARFEFPDAARHRGQIDLVVRGDWSLLWAEDTSLPHAPPNGRGTPSGLLARFRYHNQTSTLGVWIRQQAARVNVDPTYKVHVNAQQASLFATLDCRTSGSKAVSLKITLPGWTAEPPTFADVENAMPIDTTGNTLIIPIPMEAQALGRFTLNVKAHQVLTASVVSGTSQLKIQMPTVAAANPARANLAVSPAKVTIEPADNVLLTPRLQSMQALSPLLTPAPGEATPPAATGDSVPSEAGGTNYETTIFSYRDRGSSEQAVFAGDFKIQPQSISVSLANTVTLDRRSYGVEQRLSYRILYETADALDLFVPASLVDNDSGRLQFLLNDIPLAPSYPEVSGGQRVAVRVRLPRPTLGSLELRIIHARLPVTKLQADETRRFTVPLVTAATGGQNNTSVISNSLTVLHQEAVRVESIGNAWLVTESESKPGKQVLTTASDGAAADFDLSLTGSSLASSTILDQVWIQTWANHEERQDRAVFHLRTSESELRIRLPDGVGAAASTLKAVVDQRRVPVGTLDENGDIVLTLPTNRDAAARDDTELEEVTPAAAALEPTPTSHVVELWYRLPLRGRSPGTITFQPVSLDAVDHVERCYWQLIVPHSEILLRGSQPQSAQLVWSGWRGWRRAPTREQRDLERWIGASQRDSIPPEFNTYLFTSFGTPQRLEVTTGSRTLILLLSSGLALAAGLLLIYFPVLRHPAVLLAASLLILGIAFVAPELAVLFGQAAGVGIVLTLLARLLRAVLQRTQASPSTVQGRSQYSDSKMMEMRYSRPDGSSRITTASAPVAVQTPSTESKS